MSACHWAAEETDYPREVIETAFAHVIQNRVLSAHGPVRAPASTDRRLGAYLNRERGHLVALRR